MGVFDFLRVTVYDKKKAATSGPMGKPTGRSYLTVDSKSFPILRLNHKGFIVGNFDDSLIVGQKAHVSLTVDEADTRLSLTTTVLVTDTRGGRMAGEFTVLPIETEKTLRRYAERRAAKR